MSTRPIITNSLARLALAAALALAVGPTPAAEDTLRDSATARDGATVAICGTRIRLAGRRPGGITFLRIAEGHAGHTAVLALFEARAAEGPAAGARSSLHHLALSLGWDEQECAMEWLRRHGHDFRIGNFDWIGWRGAFLTDPEGNTVELVAARPAPA